MQRSAAIGPTRIFEGLTDHQVTIASTTETLYFESLCRYIRLFWEWPRWRTTLPETRLEGVLYRRIYAAPNSGPASGSEDQAIYWVAQPSQELRFIQFTYRSVAASYLGTLEYSDYRWVAGVSLPHKIRVLTSPESNTSVHELRIDRIEPVHFSREH